MLKLAINFETHVKPLHCISWSLLWPSSFCIFHICITLSVSFFRVFFLLLERQQHPKWLHRHFEIFMSLLSLDITVEMSKYKKNVIRCYCTCPNWCCRCCQSTFFLSGIIFFPSCSLYYFFYEHGWPTCKRDLVRSLVSQRITTFCSVDAFISSVSLYTQTQTLLWIAFDEPTVNPFGWRDCRTSFGSLDHNT